jgi:hypothetical protein
MHCRDFRDKHVAFVDDLLPAFEMDAMQRHLAICPACARQDIKVRRSLMLVRSLPPIEASPDFMERLNARIAESGPVNRDDVVVSRSMLTSVGSFAALAAGVAAVAYMAVETNRYFAHPNMFQPQAPAMVATTTPAVEIPAPLTNAALLSAVPTGIPVWPAVLMVGQTPARFASMVASSDEH